MIWALKTPLQTGQHVVERVGISFIIEFCLLVTLREHVYLDIVFLALE